jgi:hypothetical protein
VGKTFTAHQWINGVEEKFVGIILCANLFKENVPPIPVVATLANGYTAEKREPNEYPYVGDYNSLSGTLVHEMTHVVRRYRDNAQCKLGTTSEAVTERTDADGEQILTQLQDSSNRANWQRIT